MVKQLSGSIREFKRDSILSPLLVTLEAVLEALVPFLMAILIDTGLNHGDITAIITYGLAMVLSALIALLLGIFSGHIAARAAAGFAHNLRQDLCHHIQGFSFYTINRFTNASLITRMTTDVTNVQNAYMLLIRVLVRSPMVFLVCLILCLNLNFQLGALFLGISPFIILGIFLIIRRSSPLFTTVYQKYDQLNHLVQENLNAIDVVKSFAQEDAEIHRFKKNSREITHYFSQAKHIMSYNTPLIQSLMYFCTMAIAWLGAHFIVAGSLSTGDLASLIMYTAQMITSLTNISSALAILTIAGTSANRIAEILSDDSQLAVADHPAPFTADGSIRFEHVSFSYTQDPERTSLSDIDFSVNPGEAIGIIGETGSGKSTLVHLIPRLYDVTQGTLLVGGTDVRQVYLKALRESIAIVLQKNVLFSGTIKENLLWGNSQASDDEISKVCDLACADTFIEALPLGYHTVLTQGGTNLSEGQRQRLCIARAFLGKPKILILDDATAALDDNTDAAIQQAFRSYLPNTTKFIISQRIRSIQDTDRILVLNNGKMDALGTHNELLTHNAVYSQMVAQQQRNCHETS